MEHQLLPPQPPTLPTTLTPGSALSASTDVGAVTAWLMARGNRSKNTFSAYRHQANRLLLWLGEQGIGLRELTVEHVHQFFELLADPPAEWIRPRKLSNGEPLRPTQVFTEPLDGRSIAYARTVLTQMCGYLQDARYLSHNVFKLSARPEFVTGNPAERYLDLDTWIWLRGWIASMPASTPAEAARAVQVRWLFALLYHTGMRREEVARGVMGDFVRESRQWMLRVVGKGQRARRVTVDSALQAELRHYRQAVGLPHEYPLPTEKTPLVLPLRRHRSNKGLTPRSIGLIVHDTAKMAAADCPDEHHKARIEQMSTHWMRHTNATHRLQAGAALETTQDELGHADPGTTRIYAKTVDQKRWSDAEKLAQLSQKR